MSAEHTFRFGDAPGGQGFFVLRPARSNSFDRELARAWTAADPDHAGRVDPEFWLAQGPYTDSYLLVDPRGPVFFFRIDLDSTTSAFTCSVHIQFAPIRDPIDRMRTREGLLEGFAWLAPTLKALGVTEIFFDSVALPLVRFCVKRLGFTHQGDRLSRRLE